MPQFPQKSLEALERLHYFVATIVVIAGAWHIDCERAVRKARASSS
jgi:hypothetical protein